MDLPRALAQIAEIHATLGRTAVYRGYRSLPVAASGVIGLAGAALQPAALGSHHPVGFVLYWMVIAAAAAATGASEIIFNYVMRDDEQARRRTRQVTGQFLPGLVAGALVTLAIIRVDPRSIPLLPALWALCFAMGTFASLPYLPRASAWVGTYYFGASAILLFGLDGASQTNPWHVGGTFGVGQLLAAAVLYLKVERQVEEDGAGPP